MYVLVEADYSRALSESKAAAVHHFPAAEILNFSDVPVFAPYPNCWKTELRL